MGKATYLKIKHFTPQVAKAGMHFIAAEEWILLPDGGNLYELPGRKGIGIDVKPAKCVFVKRLGRSGIYSACAYWPLPRQLMKLNRPRQHFRYFAIRQPVGMMINFTFAVRIENDIRQECAGYDDTRIQHGAADLLKNYPHNRLVKHLMENCCLTYHFARCEKLFTSPLGMPHSFFAGLQCQLYRLHFFSTRRRINRLHARQACL